MVVLVPLRTQTLKEGKILFEALSSHVISVIILFNICFLINNKLTVSDATGAANAEPHHLFLVGIFATATSVSSGFNSFAFLLFSVTCI